LEFKGKLGIIILNIIRFFPEVQLLIPKKKRLKILVMNYVADEA
jgi:hypothetical protein